jgi:hypothetical protein
VWRLASGKLVMVGDATLSFTATRPASWINGPGPYVALSADNGTNWQGDWESESRSLVATTVQQQYSIAGVPVAGKCILKRVFKVTATSGSPDFILSFGTNTPSSIAFDVPALGAYDLTAEKIAAVGGVTNGATGKTLSAFSFSMTNGTTQADGVLNGTNGVYWAKNGTNYWILLP